MFANAMEFGQKLARAKEPQEVAQCQSEFMAKQAQTLADQTKVFGQKIQQAAQELAQTASGAMSEAAKRTADAPSVVSSVNSRAEQAAKRQRAEA
jgi:quinolinate synthase